MKVHHGEVIEKVIRRNGHSISDIARLTRVNRRSVYNWFEQQDLKPEIIYRIGLVINHDFSAELPDVFDTDDFKSYAKDIGVQNKSDEVKDEYWKNKYIELLERYNELIIHETAVSKLNKPLKVYN